MASKRLHCCLASGHHPCLLGLSKFQVRACLLLDFLLLSAPKGITKTDLWEEDFIASLHITSHAILVASYLPTLLRDKIM